MVIISGPSTVGKNPFIYKACKMFGLDYITPVTTREIRPDEKNGIDYWFFSKDIFQSKIKNGIITEWDYCLGNYYGYEFPFPGSGAFITHGLSRMALRIKAKYPKEITTVFLMPNSVDEILENIKKIYSGNTLVLREELVKEEICHAVLFDNVFIKDGPVSELLNRSDIIQLLKAESECSTKGTSH